MRLTKWKAIWLSKTEEAVNFLVCGLFISTMIRRVSGCRLLEGGGIRCLRFHCVLQDPTLLCKVVESIQKRWKEFVSWMCWDEQSRFCANGYNRGQTWLSDEWTGALNDIFVLASSELGIDWGALMLFLRLDTLILYGGTADGYC
jgi:hypothetical protein